jgi:SAM-dependent methyltransferase
MAADPYDALAPYYRDYADTRAAYLAGVDAFVREGMPTAPSALLDVGSGDGVRAMALARACGMGIVVLNDASAEMAARCRALAPADVWQVPAQQLPDTDTRFDAITCLWNVLGHVPTRNARLHALRRMASLLAPGGRLFLDVQNRHNAAAYGRWRVYGRVVLDALWPDEQRGDSSFNWHIGGRTFRGRGHLFTRREIWALIEEAGLRVVGWAAIDYATGARSQSQLTGQLAFVCEAAAGATGASPK